MANTTISQKPFGGNKWITVIQLDTAAAHTTSLPTTATSVYVHRVDVSMYAGATSAASMRYRLEEHTSADAIAEGGVMFAGGGMSFEPKCQSSGLTARAVSLTNSAAVSMTVVWSYRGGTAPTEV